MWSIRIPISIQFDGFETASTATLKWFSAVGRYDPCSSKRPRVLLVVVGVNGDVELSPITCDGLNSGVEAERLLVRKSEGGKKFN